MNFGLFLFLLRESKQCNCQWQVPQDICHYRSGQIYDGLTCGPRHTWKCNSVYNRWFRLDTLCKAERGFLETRVDEWIVHLNFVSAICTVFKIWGMLWLCNTPHSNPNTYATSHVLPAVSEIKRGECAMLNIALPWVISGLTSHNLT